MSPDHKQSAAFVSCVHDPVFFVGNRAVSVLLGLLHDSNPGRIFQRSHRRRHRYSCCGGRLDAGYFLDSRLHVHVYEQLVSFNSSHRIASLDGMSSRCVMLLKLLECSIEFECSVVFTSRVCVFCDRCSLSKHDKSNRKKSSRAWKEYELQHCHAWRTVRVIASTFVRTRFVSNSIIANFSGLLSLVTVVRCCSSASAGTPLSTSLVRQTHYCVRQILLLESNNGVFNLSIGMIGMGWVLFMRYYLIEKQRRKAKILSLKEEISTKIETSPSSSVPWLTLFIKAPFW